MTDVVNNELNQFARTVLQLANEIDAEEQLIKQELVSALQRNDVSHAMRLLQRWMDGPVTEVLADEEQDHSRPGHHGVRDKRSRRRAQTKKSSTDANV